MNIVTYYEDLGEPTMRLIVPLWYYSWHKHGWDPVVLSPCDAMHHPLHNELMERVKSWPTVNKPEYEWACWERWLAYAWYANHNGMTWFTDTDILNYGLSPLEHELSTVGLYPDMVPGYTFRLGARELEKGLDYIMAYEPNEARDWVGDHQPHVSDLMLGNCLRPLVHQWYDVEKKVGDVFWLDAKVVNYCNHECVQHFDSRLHAMTQRHL